MCGYSTYPIECIFTHFDTMMMDAKFGLRAVWRLVKNMPAGEHEQSYLHQGPAVFELINFNFYSFWVHFCKNVSFAHSLSQLQHETKIFFCQYYLCCLICSANI